MDPRARLKKKKTSLGKGGEKPPEAPVVDGKPGSGESETPSSSAAPRTANLYSGFVPGQKFDVSIGDLVADTETQPRKHFDPAKLKSLADSIREHGVYNPLLVRKDEEKGIVVVAGERRLRASRMAGLELIPVILTEGNPLEIALIENLLRDDLNIVEEAFSYKAMMEKHNYSQNAIAAIAGKHRITVNETISITRLPIEILDEVEQGEVSVSARHLILLARQVETMKPEKLFKLWAAIKDDKLTVRALEEKLERKPAEKKSAFDVVFADLKGFQKKLERRCKQLETETEKLLHEGGERSSLSAFWVRPRQKPMH